MTPPYTEEEAAEAWQWVHRHGPKNAWTAAFGTAARMIGRLLLERERLIRRQADLERQAASSELARASRC